MIKLFISLYLAIVIALLTINWGSELLWQHLTLTDETENIAEIQQAVNIAKALPALIENDAKKMQVFSQQSNIGLAIISVDDIAWLSEQRTRLLKGEAVVIYDRQQRPLIYLQAGNSKRLYQLGPLEITYHADNSLEKSHDENTQLKYIILAISYLLLAAFIALWTRPIWLDLVKLKQMASDISAGNLAISCKINKSSPTAIVVQTFQDMAKRITQLLLEQTQLVNAVSHELRTPMSRLRFSLAMLDNAKPEQVEGISNDLQEMETLVDEMLNYSRIETLEQAHSKTMVNISELLVNQVDKQKRSTEKELTVVLPDELVCLCNGHLIERASQNLITNAIRYADKQVEIKASMQNNRLIISVSDDGCGIDDKDQESIFQAFTRLDKSRNKAQGGFGLGLAIVKRIMDWHKGQCTIEKSTIGGAKFSLIIPLGES
ncbi:ATP-binding protein [Colwellia psychrerythraea]|uniref:histidine kinase n=1 Tax=Colwellia psychrerythraea TaxID=28229 RepID=A0A099KVW7_COLPS|nr:ATP-binding protein [Colwellia psychrerythraea]KGJ94889.1 integral membrane sensor signal transduction histidine kinase [Colwellia psychrerythraea]